MVVVVGGGDAIGEVARDDDSTTILVDIGAVDGGTVVDDTSTLVGSGAVDGGTVVDDMSTLVGSGCPV